MLQVVFLQLRPGNKTLRHSLKLNINLRVVKQGQCSVIPNKRSVVFFVYHAPLGVVRFAGGVVVDVLPVELGVVHVGFLHDLIRDTQLKPAQIFNLDERRETHGHDPCDARLFAVAVIKEGQLPRLHLPQEITGLQTNEETNLEDVFVV